MAKKQWKKYPHNPKYAISDHGDVVRINRDPRVAKFRRLVPVMRDGYLFVSIGANNQKPVHTLVLETFKRDRRPGEVCRHLNGVRNYNRLSNLKWGTPKENEADKAIHGTKVYGEKQHLALLTNAQARQIYTSNRSVTELADKYGVTVKRIRAIKDGRVYSDVTKDLIAGNTYLGKVRGHEHGRSELTKEEARQIMIAPGMYHEIAATFGVSKHIVGAIKRGERYGDATRGLKANTSGKGGGLKFKLTSADREKIAKSKKPVVELARQFNVNSSTISRIRSRHGS